VYQQPLWHSLSRRFGRYVVLGCDNTHPGCRGGVVRLRGGCWNARMVGERIVSAPDHPVYCGGLFFMRNTRRASVVYCLLNPLSFVAFKMGRLRGGPSRTGAEGAYRDRYVTDEQRSSRPIFNATLRAAARWVEICSDQACRPVFSRSRISVSSFSSADGPDAGATMGFLKRFTCLMTMNRQKAIMRNSMTVLMNMP
jgi:hypothetical protein